MENVARIITVSFESSGLVCIYIYKICYSLPNEVVPAL